MSFVLTWDVLVYSGWRRFLGVLEGMFLDDAGLWTDELCQVHDLPVWWASIIWSDEESNAAGEKHGDGWVDEVVALWPEFHPLEFTKK